MPGRRNPGLIVRPCESGVGLGRKPGDGDGHSGSSDELTEGGLTPFSHGFPGTQAGFYGPGHTHDKVQLVHFWRIP